MNGYRRLLRLLLGKRLPRTSGTLRLAGPQAEIAIGRDRYGIPHIQARSDGDAAFALGFCQGQDRAFQLEILLRMVRGTLADLAGERALPVDRLSRRIGFRRSVEEQLHASGDELATFLGAFAAGVTAGASVGSRRIAHEFVLLRSRPTPWEAADVLGVNRLVAFLLGSNWDAELARLKMLAEDGVLAVASLDAPGDDSLPVISAAAEAETLVDRLAEDLELFGEVAAIGGASNNWVVAGSRTASGRPLLANDPHLGPTCPPHWYLAHLRTPEWETAGAVLAGTPAILVGFNKHGAWGVTAALTDNTDLFVEELHGDLVRDGDRLVPCERRVEVIGVRRAEPVHEEVLLTPNGPIISPALDAVGHAISLRATWLESRPIVGFARAHRARSFAEFRRLFEHWPAVPLNVVWADTSGTIGWQLAGALPRRRKGLGMIPRPGWDPAARWEEEPVPFAKMPHLADPEEGYIATANNKPLPDGAGPYLGGDWADGYRAARIVEALASRDDWDVDGMLELQLDVVSLPWREMREVVLAVRAGDDDSRLAQALLAAWDGALTGDSAAGTVYELLVSDLIRRFVTAKAPNSARWAAGEGFHSLVPSTLYGRRRLGQLVRLLRERPEGWLEGSWPEEISDALGTAVASLRERLGDDPDRWAWGRVRPLFFRHALGRRRSLGRIFNLGPLPGGGDSSTVAQAAVAVDDPTAPPWSVASLRAVIDVGDWEASRFALPGGQSGNPASAHYDDLLPLWQAGSGVPIAWLPETVRRESRATLRLLPA